jgi:hypothetical protein
VSGCTCGGHRTGRAARELEATRRELSALRVKRGAPIIKAALEDGRIEYAERESWLRRFALSPEITIDVLNTLPGDALRMSRNLAAANPLDEDKLYTAARLGLDPDELI